MKINQTSVYLAGIAATVLSNISPAQAEGPRRPGLGGQYSTRKLTAPLNSLGVIAGPGQTPLFGQRYAAGVIDGGISYARTGLRGTEQGPRENELWARVGVVFGLTEHLEAGALFLNFRLTPDFSYSDFPVYLTYGWTFKNVDIGARFSFTTPPETGIWNLNPGLPMLIRLGSSRIDTGIFVPMTMDKPFTLGLNAPTRFTHNFTPRLFAGLESGFAITSFRDKAHVSLPLGALFGYSLVSGAKVLDFTASFSWDDFMVLGGSNSIDTMQLNAFRALAGITIHKVVM